MKILQRASLKPGKRWLLGAAIIMICGLLFCGAAAAQEQSAPDPAENRAAFLSFLQGSLESGFMDEWRGKRSMKTMEDVGEYLSTFNLWAFACQDGPNFNLNAQEAELLANFRKKAAAVQAEAFPKLRDKFGPVLRQQIGQVQAAGRTVGQGFRTVEFYGAPFSNANNITQFQAQVQTVLLQLRFEKADYKTTSKGAVVKSIPIGSFKDTDMIVWSGDTVYNVVE